MIKNVPRNYSNDLDRRRQGLDSITENLLPDVETTDAGKIMKVGEDGKWHLGSDENTIIVPNPDEQPTVDLEKLQIGSTVYSVKNPELTSIKSFKLTMSNGGQYNTNKPIIEFYNEGGQKASITSSDYTVVCDKTYAGNAGMDQVCSISTPDTPGTFTYTFVNDFDIETYNLIKLTRGGTFLNDIAKNIKLELSADGENYLTIYDETTITWSDAVPYHLISLKDGSEASTLLPVVTSSDANTLLQVNSDGVWSKGLKIPELHMVGNNKPAVQSVLLDENGVILAVPRIEISCNPPWKVIDNEGYYTITKCSLNVLTGVRNGVVGPIKPSDFDIINVCGATSLYVNLYLNDGTNNLWLIGNTNCRSGSVSSSNTSPLVIAFEDCFLVNRQQFADIYKAYDATLTYNNDVDNPYDWTLKFKLEKIVTT